jgi:hypothetical protein
MSGRKQGSGAAAAREHDEYYEKYLVQHGVDEPAVSQKFGAVHSHYRRTPTMKVESMK